MYLFYPRFVVEFSSVQVTVSNALLLLENNKDLSVSFELSGEISLFGRLAFWTFQTIDADIKNSTMTHFD